eukprot:Skav220918  [mRNA]  locus=scaffold1145:135971:138004:+ [translate_table: standard]
MPGIWARQSSATTHVFQETGPPLRLVERGRGNLFLQAIQVSIPASAANDGVTVRVAPSERFAELLQQSQDAWARGWRADAQGITRRGGRGHGAGGGGHGSQGAELPMVWRLASARAVPR